MNFKNIMLPALAGLAALLSFASCDNENEYHSISFPNDPYGAHQLYADQEADTLYLFCTDSWKAGTSGGDWFTISPNEHTMAAMSPLLHKIVLTTTPNTTGKTRSGLVTVAGHDQISLTILQRSYLNILAPAGIQTDSVRRYVCEMTQTVGAGNVAFQVYKDGATLKSSAGWLVPADTLFDAGAHQVEFTVTANPDTVRREATLTLTSNGVSTPIEVVQLPKSK